MKTCIVAVLCIRRSPTERENMKGVAAAQYLIANAITISEAAAQWAQTKGTNFRFRPSPVTLHC